MIAFSILYPDPTQRIIDEDAAPPEFFSDLNLDQLVESIVAGHQNAHLQPYFFSPLDDIDAIHYRQEVMRDLETAALQEVLSDFTKQMAQVQRYQEMITHLDYRINQAGWFLEAVITYGRAVRKLDFALKDASLNSRGMQRFRNYLQSYLASNAFHALMAEADQVKAEVSSVRFCVRIKEGTVWVSKCEDRPDYSVDVLKTFERFKEADAKDYSVKYRPQTGMNHVDAQIIACAARFYPEIFSHLQEFHAENQDFLDATIGLFHREIQFYLAFLTFTQGLKRAGLSFCYPEITTEKNIFSHESFDLALADKLIPRGQPVVVNDFYLQEPERIIIVTGPNQGGKTTFARTFGQLHYLARLGCPTPGASARLFFYDHLFTQFEREEDISTLRGKLADDLVRLHETLDRATANSLVIMNEVFSSTTLQDAVFISKKIMSKLETLDAISVFVTFLDELASFSDKTVSMVSTVDPENPAHRTYKIVRKPADGLAYALSIAEKHGLTYKQIMERLGP